MPWIKVKKGTEVDHCPICGSHDWCGVGSDGRVARCMRVKEGSYRESSGGYLHKLTKDTVQISQKPYNAYQEKPKPAVDFYQVQRIYVKAVKDYQPLADELGVSVESLKRLGAGWDGKVWCFPMRSGRNQVIGISRRTKPKKCCVTGSQIGLFIPDGVEPEGKGPLYICEGPTDCAALLDMGFDAIGRQGCTACVDKVQVFLKQGYRGVVIMSDNDPPKTRPHDGSVWYPGQEGAMSLAEAIKKLVRSVRVIKPPKHKDVRQWYRNGCTKPVIETLVRHTKDLK